MIGAAFLVLALVAYAAPEGFGAAMAYLFGAGLVMLALSTMTTKGR